MAESLVLTRRACEQLLLAPDAAREGPFAARLGPELFGTKDAPVDAAAVAGELKRRTEVPARTYWFAAVAATVPTDHLGHLLHGRRRPDPRPRPG